MTKSVELWIGEHPRNFLPDGKFLSTHDNVMDSVANYYKEENPRIPYRYQRLFLDNGAYTAARRGIALETERVKDLQECLNPYRTIPLDYPLLPGMSVKEMKKRWRGTQRNALDWYETTTLKEIVPALHAWSLESLDENLRWLAKHADSDYVAIGSIVSERFEMIRPFFGDRFPNRTMIDMMIECVQRARKLTGFSIHMMGFGSSPLTLHLGFFCGVNSIDTAGYRRGAAFGKIILPGTGWRSIGKKARSFGVPPPSPSEFESLSKCHCPVCKKNQSYLFSNWKARAVHNRYVLQCEESRARRLIETDFAAYEEYVGRLFARSRAAWLFKLWEHARSRIHRNPFL